MATAHPTDGVVDLFGVTDDHVKKSIRYHAETRKFAITDVISLLTGKNANHSAEMYRRLTTGALTAVNFDLVTKHQFPGSGQKPIHVAPFAVILQIIMLCSGRAAARGREHFARTLARVYGADPSLVSQMQAQAQAIGILTMATAQPTDVSIPEARGHVDCRPVTVPDVLEKIRFDRVAKLGSILDVIQLVTGCSHHNASKTFQKLCEHYPEVNQKIFTSKFPGQGQRPTPVAPIPVLIEIAWLCNGKNAARFRREGVHVFCRALGGDLSLIDDIKARHGMMEGTLEQEALLEGTGVTMAEANGQAAVPAPSPELAALEVEERKMHVRQIDMELKERDLKFVKDILTVSSVLKDVDATIRTMLLDTLKTILSRGITESSTAVLAPPPVPPVEIPRPISISTTIPSGLDDAPGLHERAARLCVPAVTRTIFGAHQTTAIAVAIAMFRELWGSSAPRELRSLVGRTRCVRELRGTSPLVFEMHRTLQARKRLLVHLCRAFRQLTKTVVHNRLYQKRAIAFLAELGVEGVDMTVEDAIECNAAYDAHRRKVGSAARVKFAKELRRHIFGDMRG